MTGAGSERRGRTVGGAARRLLATLRSPRKGAEITAAPPAIWRAFAAQGAWKSWVIVALLGLLAVNGVAMARLANRPPEYVLVDGDGKATYVKSGVATEALLRFLQDKTKPPELTIVRFTRTFLELSLAIDSLTVEANWPAALAMMNSELRERVAKEAAAAKMVEGYKLSQQKTTLKFEDIQLVTRTSSLLHVRARISRSRRSRLDPSAPAVVDDVVVDLAEQLVTPRLDRPDGLEVVGWSLEKLGEKAAVPAESVSTNSNAAEDSNDP
jgi:hypothetical protein